MPSSIDDTLFTELVRSNHAPEIRKEAILKRAEYENLLQESRAALAAKDPNAKIVDWYTEELDGSNLLLAWGDRLRTAPANENNKNLRRRLYAEAFMRLRAAQAELSQSGGLTPP